ncbi:MAG: SpoIID/LytB domain-containing protein [Bdellovibrionaceae bacterium]|nr:SpoIID/LytB domain-containing protein [Pseudobdellovibrionaceae bacterium]
MQVTSCFSFFFAFVISFSARAISVDESWIRVRIFENLKLVQIQGAGLEIVNKAELFRGVSVTKRPINFLEIQFQKKWNHGFLLIKNDRASSELKSESVFLKGDGLSVAARSVGDFLQLYKRPNGFDVIVYVRLRDYLRGVVSAEVPVSWPEETLKAQIVAARSYVLFMSERRKALVFDVEASIKDQVYKHTTDTRLEPLLEATKDLVLFDQHKNIFKAYYHSECGGQTSSAKRVFGDTQFDAEVKDPYCQGRVWRLKTSKNEIERYFGTFKQLVNTFNPRGRAYAITVEKPDLTREQWSAQDLRMKIGSTRMKSTWFEARVVGNQVEFVGKGYGHGVGLCQWGSRQMGLMKKSFRDILSFYYPGAVLKKVASERLI